MSIVAPYISYCLLSKYINTSEPVENNLDSSRSYTVHYKKMSWAIPINKLHRSSLLYDMYSIGAKSIHELDLADHAIDYCINYLINYNPDPHDTRYDDIVYEDHIHKLISSMYNPHQYGPDYTKCNKYYDILRVCDYFGIVSLYHTTYLVFMIHLKAVDQRMECTIRDLVCQ